MPEIFNNKRIRAPFAGDASLILADQNCEVTRTRRDPSESDRHAFFCTAFTGVHTKTDHSYQSFLT